MSKLVLYGFVIMQLFSFTLFAQDDTEEETVGAPIFNLEDLDGEESFLNFKTAFIESIRQKSIENYKKALEALDKCEKIYPENVAMLFEKAKNHFALKQYIEAHFYCEKALSIEPTNVWIMALSRDVFEKEFNYPEAIAIQKKLFKTKNSEAEYLLKMYYKTKNIKEGKLLISEIEKKYIYINNFDFYKKYFTRDNTNTSVKNPVINNDFTNKNLGDLKRAFAKDKEYKILQEILEKEAQTKQFELLLTDSDLGLSLFPAQAKVYLYKGMALNGLKKHKQAIPVLESGLDFVIENKNLTKQFYNALIISFTETNNTLKANHYKELVQKL